MSPRSKEDDALLDLEMTTATGESEDEDDREEEYMREDLKFKEDLYEFAACSIINDSWRIAKRRGSRGLRFGRLAFSIFLLYTNIVVQIFLLSQVKKFISAAAVHDIRIAYSDFQEAAYDKEFLSKTVNGHFRGSDGHFHPDVFDSLAEDDKESLCQFPMSQPMFAGVILFIWGMTCVGEIDSALRMTNKLVIQLPTKDKTGDIIEWRDGGDEGDPDKVVVGLTTCLKVMLSLGIVLPQMAIATFMLWLGSRWLLATRDFADLMLNAVALEFIILLKDLFYRTVVSDWNKKDIDHTRIHVTPDSKKEEASVVNLFLAVLWAPLVALWVFLYMFQFQAVLPEYRWDVHTVCDVWVAERFSV